MSFPYLLGLYLLLEIFLVVVISKAVLLEVSSLLNF
jgi:hypothetical protein